MRDFIGGRQKDEENFQSEDLVARNSTAAAPTALSASEEVNVEKNKQPDQNAISRQRSSEGALPTGRRERGSRTEQASPEFAPSAGFDQAVRDLRAAKSADTRAAAARILSGAGGQRATPHLIAALERIRAAAARVSADLAARKSRTA